jgi:hypothetical protein
MLRLAPADADSELWRHFRVSWIVLILPSVSPRRSESDTSYVVSPFSRGSNVPASKTTHIIGTSLLRLMYTGEIFAWPLLARLRQLLGRCSEARY